LLHGRDVEVHDDGLVVAAHEHALERSDVLALIS